MADIQHIQCKNQQKTSSNRRNIVPYMEIAVKESNAGARFLTGPLEAHKITPIAFSPHAQ